MKLRRRAEYDCRGCGAGLSGRDMKRRLAVVRGDEVFCRECFRSKFPGECLNHPGKEAARECAMCQSPCCGDCVVEIQGKFVCAMCKPVALGRVAEGGAIGPLDFSEPAGDEPGMPELPHRYRMVQWVRYAPFHLTPKGILLLGAASVFVFPAAPLMAAVLDSAAAGLILASVLVWPAVAALYFCHVSRDRFDYGTMRESFLAGAGKVLAGFSCIFQVALVLFFGLLLLQGHGMVP